MKRKIFKDALELCTFEQRHYFKKIDEQAIIKLKHPHKKKFKLPSL